MNRLTRHLPALDQALPRLRWWLSRGQQALGFWGVLALAIMLAALFIQLTLITPAAGQDALRRQELHAGIAEQPQDVQVTEPAVVEKLPSAEDFALRLERVLGLIQQHGFVVDQTTLGYSAASDFGVQRLEVDIPLAGSYASLRTALTAVAGEPAVRIESLTLERQAINTPQLVIGLKLSLLGVME